MLHCAVRSCTSDASTGHRLYKFPSRLKNAARRKIWEEYSDGENLPETPLICELHFSDEQYEMNSKSGRKRLKSSAIPDTVYVLQLQNADGKVEESIQIIVEDSDDEIENIHLVVESENNDCVNGTKLKFKTSDCNLSNIYEVELKSEMEVETCDNVLGENTILVNMQEKLSQIMKKRTLDDITVDTPKKRQREDLQPEEVQKLQEELQRAHGEIEDLENLIFKMRNGLQKLFNEDQIRFLLSGSPRGTTYWSKDTMNRSLTLYNACGPDGYEEILSQNLPYPSVHSLQKCRKKVNKGENSK